MIPLADRPALVRDVLSRNGVDGFILPRGDEHLGEYVAPCAERLAWLTGFTGSAGMAILMLDDGAVFSDGRYVTQLEQQVDGSIWQRQHLIEHPPVQWLREQATGKRIGYDPRLMSEAALNTLRDPSFTLVPLAANPVDAVWKGRPPAPATPVILQDTPLSGEASKSKRARIAQILKNADEQAVILGDPTSVAWLLNIRATDVPCTPVALAFAILHDDGTAELFIDATRLDAAVMTSFSEGVTLRPADALPAALAAVAGKRVRIDPAATSQWFLETLTDIGATVSRNPDPCVLPKSRKNLTEQAGAREAHRLDSVALCRFLHWVSENGTGLAETALSAKLNAFRAESPDYRGESFDAISGSGPNGAIIHYRATPGQDRTLQPNEVYLIDSGGQYTSGTTDVTRTVWSGPDAAPDDIRQAFTRVLKGNIALSRIRFPKGVTGHRLDTLARMALWQAGMDYDHGTGHGIGSYLSVHEGPCNISSVPRPVPLEPGMIISNEPGYYRPGAFGIRQENLLLVKPSAIVPDRFLEFEVLTYAPFDRALMDVTLLSPEDMAWLNDYHADVLERTGPLLDEPARLWLEKACAPLMETTR